MMKRIVCLTLCCLLTFLVSFGNAADGPKHEKDLETILLGRTLTPGSKDPETSKDKEAVLFGYLEDAVYLCVDQMDDGKDKGQQWLDELNNVFHVKGLPKSVDEFTVPMHDHEKYTHMGWDYPDYPEKEKWQIRQNILLATVSKVFEFPIDESKSGQEKYSNQCINMAKLIYYIHILGDHEENSFESRNQRIQLRQGKEEWETEKGLVAELRECLKEVFWNKRTDYRYNWLMVKLNVIRYRAWLTGEEKNEGKHKKVGKIAKDALSYLSPTLRNLLLQMDFYKKVFPKKENP